jgi:hypothetical protein
MDDNNKRTFDRVLKNKTLKIKSCDNPDQETLAVTLMSVNLSETGVLFESSRKYDVGSEYFIRFTGNDNQLYDIRIEIIRVEEVITGAQYNIGAQFIETDSDKIQKLCS